MFVCVDIEATGLDLIEDRIVEIGICVFDENGITEQYETLVNPKRVIPEETIKIHHITNDMVVDQPSIEDILPHCLKMLKGHTIVGHGIAFDINMIAQEAKRHQIPCTIEKQTSIDTLRLARLYGDSPTNSLEALRIHFNIEQEGAHRAMNDVIVNIAVYHQLAKQFKSTHALLQRLKSPIKLKAMPLGKHKGRLFPDIPIDYLYWAAHQKFDQDLMFSIESEIRARKKTKGFRSSTNPFSSL